MTTATLTETPPPQAPRARRRYLTLDNRYLPPFLITCILLRCTSQGGDYA